jgi:hypothetical protein
VPRGSLQYPPLSPSAAARMKTARSPIGVFACQPTLENPDRNIQAGQALFIRLLTVHRRGYRRANTSVTSPLVTEVFLYLAKLRQSHGDQRERATALIQEEENTGGL